MATSTDFLQEYQQTEEAYCQGNYEEAAALVYQLVEDYPEDPSARLLCGHIYGYGLQQYDVARDQYMAVLNLTSDAELLEQAHQALADTDQYELASPSGELNDIPDSQAVFNALLDEEIDSTEVDLTQDLQWVAEETNGFANGTSSMNLLNDLESLADDSHQQGNGNLMNGSNHEIDLKDFSGTEDNFDFQGLEDSELSLSVPDLDDAIDERGLEHLGDNQDYLHSNGSQSPLSFTADNPFALEDDLEEGTEILNPLDEPGSLTQFDEDPFTLEEDESQPITPLATDEVSVSDLEQLTGDLFSSEDDQFHLLDSSNPSTEDDLHSLNSQETLDESEMDYLHQPTQFLDLDDLEGEGEFGEPRGAEEDEELMETPESSPQTPFPSSPSVAPMSFEEELDDIFAPLEEIDSSGEFVNPDPVSSNGMMSGASTPLFEPEEEEEFDPDLSGFTFSVEPFVDDADDSVPLPPDPSNMTANFNVLDAEESNEEETLLTNNRMNQSYFSNTRGEATPSSAYGALDMAEEEDDIVFDATDIPDSFDLEPLNEDTFGDSFDITPEMTDLNGRSPNGKAPQSVENDFLDSFEEFDDVADFDMAASGDNDLYVDSDFGNLDSKFPSTTYNNSTLDSDSSSIRDDEIFNSAYTASAVTTLSPDLGDVMDTVVASDQGPFSFLENASLNRKPFYTALGTGLVTLILVATATNIATRTAALDNKREVVDYLRVTGWFMTTVAGATSFITAWGLGRITAQQITKATDDLQAQFDAIGKGNLDARATVFAEDEFGRMSAKFNHAAQFIQNITREAQRKAKEQEDARDDLHRQVIRLLDDVEGAARGDLTVTAEVTANVLGAVADSFNLTIQNLREIVVQVKQAARQVSKGATDSATFAKDVAGDAFRQAEELAATLNSIQVLTDAIQRVAESSREAEEVARSAAAVATKGGEAVQMTVAGILKIRETVAETSREVKRLGESSQEISKIVAIISQIASRTNLLALNASIEAARAGEAGKGFAIVADEVRQLADKSAKSLKDIEQIVMQIQSQTNTVMMAMSQGHQQVIEGTRLAEQAKRALDDIIQVTNRIDVLVRSITADTVEQNETARAVAQVMRAVEHSAQETSQEAQGVSSALTKLVGVARDLLTSVERFRVDASEKS
ncbi:Putative methyl-accepting chemotaxis protein sll0041 [Planktothrix tepida]|uniref:Chemotaxis sensory transducer n=1 Tax=Planktothrix tepida PCC 9214 TaxID=671072 RepID=A0A1J1LJ44_9CYAN|nr:methyl-accepting chemotaxis protein [Planktothrix tepida]CAD5911468.1 Putative methyl-accepting chemotaxis protein sll0041 [Planktothrix tepida]CUR32058.1 Chemotaxis sensory transducer [Planktothrix tepida PCC 9214]